MRQLQYSKLQRRLQLLLRLHSPHQVHSSSLTVRIVINSSNSRPVQFKRHNSLLPAHSLCHLSPGLDLVRPLLPFINLLSRHILPLITYTAVVPPAVTVAAVRPCMLGPTGNSSKFRRPSPVRRPCRRGSRQSGNGSP